jgi:membrane associated rhomboid family serine protease
MFIPIGIPGFILGALYLLYSYYQGKQLGDNINHDAHLFGALYGVLFTVIVFPQSISLFFEQIKNFSF